MTTRLGLSANSARVICVYTNNITGTNTVRLIESSDSGATWRAPATITSGVGTISPVACALYDSSGTATIFYAVGGTVYAIQRTGTGAWGAAAAWSHTTMASINALAAKADLDYNVVLSGVLVSGSGSHAVVYATNLGTGAFVPAGTWSALEQLALASSGTSVTLRALAVGFSDVARALLQEEHAGPTYGPVQMASGLEGTDFDPPQFSDPRALDYTQEYGLGFAGNAEVEAWLVSARGVWHAPFTDGVLTLTDDVLEVDYTSEPNGVGRARVVLRNEDGRYGEDATQPPIEPGVQLEIAPGYVTTAGNEQSAGPVYWLDRVTRRRGADGTAVVVLEGSDAFGALARWRAPRQLSWAAGSPTASLIVAAIARAAGIDALPNWSSEASINYKPAFTVPAGADGLASVRRLVARLPDDLRTASFGSGLVAFSPATADSSGYSCGGDHPLAELELSRTRAALGWARVLGSGVRSEATSAAALERGGPAVVEVDRNLTVQARADARASSMLREAATTDPRGTFVARPFVGLEAGDVVDLTDATLGLAGDAFRVARLRLRYARGARAPRYELVVEVSER